MPWRESDAQLERARAERAETILTPRGALYAIVTPAAPAAPAAGRCVVFFTRPRSHRNRMWVEAARELAARGFAACRFDYHGCGDSEGESGHLDPNHPYAEDAVAVLRHLRSAHGETRFVLIGSCFDARTALSAFTDEGTAIEGIAFIAAPVMELGLMVAAHAGTKDWKHLAKSLRNPGNWTSLARAGRWRHMATVLGRVTKKTLGGGEAPNDTPLADSFVRHFRALERSRARALFLYGETDQELASFRVAQETLLREIPPSMHARFETEIWPADIHGFLNVPLQRRALERCLAWALSFHPDAGTRARGGAASGARAAAGA